MNGEAILDLARSIVLILILVHSIHLIKTNKQPVLVRFFTLAIACILFSDIYWLAYDILRPESRLPFAANEISEWAMFLLFGASLASVYPIHFNKYKKEIIGSCLFSAANVGLWIAWSGEWVQDILTGCVMAYFLSAIAVLQKEEHVFSKSQKILLTIVCIVLVTIQSATFFVPDYLYTYLDHFCYLLLFTTGIILIVHAFAAMRKENGFASVGRAFTAFAWCVITMYMSADFFHLMAMFLVIVCFIIIFTTLCKEVEAA